MKTHLYEFPEVASQFHHIKNEGVDLYSLRKATNIKYWWLCQSGHEWQASVNQRTRGCGCPYCSGRMATKENNLAITHPELALQWSPKNELSPCDYLAASGKKVWWVCSQGYEWESAIYHRKNGRLEKTLQSFRQKLPLSGTHQKMVC